MTDHMTNSMQKVKGNVHISPNGAVFVRSKVRRGIMPRSVAMRVMQHSNLITGN